MLLIFRSRQQSGGAKVGDKHESSIMTAFGSKFCKSPSVGKTSTTRAGGRTATVTPSDTLCSSKKPSKPLTRFGFSSYTKSGDSTDSVNSILSDALVVSDTNSNALDSYEEQNGNCEKIPHKVNVNKTTKTMNLKNTLLVQTTEDRTIYGRSNSSSRCEDVLFHSTRSPKSPTSISQASSGVTSASNVITAKLKAHTLHLPQPQLPAVKSFGARKQMSLPKKRSPVNVKKRPVSYAGTGDCLSSRAVISFQPYCNPKSLTSVGSCAVTFKAVTSAAIPKSFSATPSPVDDKEEDSPKSINTLDSGLGSSTEGDKLKISKSSYRLEEDTSDTITITEPKHVGKNCEPQENMIKSALIDESDKWLREKKNKMGKASKLQTGFALKPANRSIISEQSESSFKNISSHDISETSSTIVSITPDSDTKEESDLHLSYGAARQKFALYERNRFGFGGIHDTTQSNEYPNKPKLSKMPSDPGSRRIISSTSKQSKLTRVHSAGITKMSNIRPTSLIKSPILVTPVSNETVEISRPIMKRLGYTETKEDKNTTSGDRVRHRKNSAEDLLMVSCLERPAKDATEDDSQLGKEISNSDRNREIEFSKKLNHKSTNSYNVLESPTVESNTATNTKSETHSFISPSSETKETKLLSPDSVSSFEVLDTPTEDLDIDSGACIAVFNQDSLSSAMSNSICISSQATTSNAHLAKGSGLNFNIAGYNNVIDSKEIDQLTSSLKRSSLVESLASAVMTESLEASVSHSSMSSAIVFTSDPSTYYNIAAAVTTSASSDTATDYTHNGSSLNTNDVINEAQNTRSDDSVMENRINNFNVSNLKKNTTSHSSILSFTHADDDINEISPIKHADAIDALDIQQCSNLLTSPSEVRQMLNSTTSAGVATISEMQRSSDNSIHAMSNSAVFSDTNSCDRCSPSTIHSQNKCGSGSGANGTSSNSADIDQDFLIDDEISDQPDLTFAGDEMCGDQTDLSGAFGDTPHHHSYHHHHHHHHSYLTPRDDNSITSSTGRRTNNISTATNSEPLNPMLHSAIAHGGIEERHDMAEPYFSDEAFYAEDMHAPSPCQAVRKIGKISINPLKPSGSFSYRFKQC